MERPRAMIGFVWAGFRNHRRAAIETALRGIALMIIRWKFIEISKSCEALCRPGKLKTEEIEF
jgi:hypothetical protein